MPKKLLLYLVILLFPGLLTAQSDAYEYPSNALGMGIYAHTFGFGFNVQYWRQLNANDLLIDFSIRSIKDRRENRIESAYKDQGGKDYIFDKRNYFYSLDVTGGLSRWIIPKSDFNKLAIKAGFSAGPSIGLLKPYYVEVAMPVPNSPSQAYVDIAKYNAAQFGYYEIVGQADYFLGVEEIKVQPGITAKVHGLLDFSSDTDYIRGVELTAFGSYYLSQVPILDTQKNKQFFVGASIGLLIGNTW